MICKQKIIVYAEKIHSLMDSLVGPQNIFWKVLKVSLKMKVFLVSLCPTFVPHPCVPPKFRALNNKKPFVAKGFY